MLKDSTLPAAAATKEHVAFYRSLLATEKEREGFDILVEMVYTTGEMDGAQSVADIYGYSVRKAKRAPAVTGPVRLSIWTRLFG